MCTTYMYIAECCKTHPDLTNTVNLLNEVLEAVWPALLCFLESLLPMELKSPEDPERFLEGNVK